MGELKSYYYLKRKPRRASQSVDFGNHGPEIVLPPIFPANLATIWPKDNVLDLNFKASKQSKLILGAIRWGLLIVLASLIYAAGAWINSGSQEVKDTIVRKSNAATINLQAGATALAQFNLNDALNNFRLADRNFNSALKSFAVLGQSNLSLANLPLNYSEITSGQLLINGGHHLAQAGIKLTQALQPLGGYLDSVKAGDKSLENIATEISNLLRANAGLVDKAVGEAELANNLLMQLSPKDLPPEYAVLAQSAQVKAQTFYQFTQVANTLVDRLPAMIGFDNPQYYLLLNQNPNEARPTGGFIGSYVLIRLYKGKIEKLFIDDIHRLDGQNRNNDVELPTPLRAVTAYYGMRDANWEPDFPTSVRTIQKLYEQAGGGTVDGIVALTPEIISDVLSVLGNLSMPKYGLELTPNNLALSVQKNIEIDRQGTYSPKQLLMDAAPVLIQKFLAADQKQLSLIGQKLIKRLMAKDILLYFADPELESIAKLFNWGGEVPAIGQSDDYLSIIEANLGGNKSSASLNREVNHTVSIAGDGTISDSLQLIYHHQGSSKFPDGTNKNYVRIYLPNGAKINQLSGYDTGTQIDNDTVFGKTVVGFWLTTEPGASNAINIEYVLPFKLDFVRQQATYRLIIQKQPGIYKNMVKSQIQVANNLSLSQSGQENLLTKAIFSGALIKDGTLTTKIYKK